MINLWRNGGDEKEALHSMQIRFDDNSDRTEVGMGRHRAAYPRAERIAELARDLVDAQRERSAWSRGRAGARNPRARMSNPFPSGSVEHQAYEEGVAFENALQFQAPDW